MKRFVAYIAALCMTASTFAQQTRFGDWSIGLINDGSGMYAATVNDSGHVFGKYCYTETQMCYWTISINSTCEEDGSYAGLLNGENAGVHVNSLCVRSTSDNSNQIIHPFDLIERQVKGSGRMGIAFPMSSGEFRVYRWSLRGSSAAIKAMDERFLKMPKPNNTKNQTL